MSERLERDPVDVPFAVARAAHSRWRLSVIWIVPLVAAIAGGWVALRAFFDQGPAITIAFTDADGLEPGKTKVRYKSVDVGLVRRITFTPDHHSVQVTVDLEKGAEPFLVSDTKFWVVRPRLGASGVSGLGTLFSGAYIAADLGTSSSPARSFVGLATPPVITEAMKGTAYVLHADDLGSLDVGSPAYFKHIQVGQISSVTLNSDGHGITLGLFVNAPFDQFVTDDTRFWHASGVDIAVDTDGLHVETQSLSAILAGGIALEGPPGSTALAHAPPGSEFRLAPDHSTAMKSPDRVVETYVLNFDESLRGLSPGAIVDFRGVEIGEVTEIKVEYDARTEKFQFPVFVNIYPERMQSRFLEGGARPDQHFYLMVARMIAQGLRAQLRTASLLTGKLYVAIDFYPDAAKVVARPELTPMPLPTIPGNLEELQSSVVRIARKLDQLPIDRIGTHLDAVLSNASTALIDVGLLARNIDAEVAPEVRSAFAQATTTLKQADRLVGPDAALQNDLRSTLRSVSRAADSIRVFVDYLDTHPESLVRGKAKAQ
jgi:paraquat-inducible protein B